MMRSMFSGVSGLRAHQMKMDIIGNNIANVNTVGYKGQRATFQEVFNQTIKGAGSPQSGRGGTNPQQVGLGISMSSIDTMQVRGAVQRTDNITDLAINGDGFFILSNDSAFLNRSFTRAGNFALDEDGNLVASNGYKVLGYMVDPVTGEMGNSLQGLQISKSQSADAQASSYGQFEGNLDNTLQYATEDLDVTKAAAPDNKIDFGADKYWESTSTFYDSLGGQHKLQLTFVRGIGTDGAALDEATDPSTWGVVVKDLETGQYFTFDGAASGTSVGVTSGATGATTQYVANIKFGTDGKLDTSGLTGLSLTVPGKNGSNDIVGLDIKFSDAISGKALTQFANESTASITTKDGFPQGSLDTFSIGPTGEINAVFTNGQSGVIGQVALAVFKNPSGLEKTTENMFQTTPNSGDPIYGQPGSGGMGALNPGTLEMSNVDISREFTEMISTERGFQANSRIITTSDEMLQELVNLKR